jgi:hypothetical protein
MDAVINNIILKDFRNIPMRPYPNNFIAAFEKLPNILSALQMKHKTTTENFAKLV